MSKITTSELRQLEDVKRCLRDASAHADELASYGALIRRGDYLSLASRLQEQVNEWEKFGT